MQPTTSPDMLISSHIGFANAIARRVHKRLPFAEFDDMQGAAMEGLLQAARRYDPTCGNTFATFAYHRVRGAVFDSLRHSGPAPGTDPLEEDLHADAPENRPDAAVARLRLRARVHQAISGLPKERKALIESHYFAGETLQDAGRNLGFSKSWASRLHQKAIEQLREHLEDVTSGPRSSYAQESDAPGALVRACLQ